jgi:hypothetical protein
MIIFVGSKLQRRLDDVTRTQSPNSNRLCFDKFQHGADAASNLVEFNKVSSWQQSSFIGRGGWATMPGGKPANAAVAQACATMLSSLQK